MTFIPDSVTKTPDIAEALKKKHDERKLFLDTNGRNYLRDPGNVNNSDLAGTVCALSILELEDGISTLSSSTILSKYTVNLRGNRKGASTIDCFAIPAGQFAFQHVHDNTDVTALPSGPFSVTSGSPTMTITYTSAHGLSVNSDVRIAGASTFAGLSSGDINRLHRVVSVPSTTTVTVTLPANANATLSSQGGASVTALSNLNGNDTTAIEFTLGTDPLSIANGSNVLTITYPSAHSLAINTDVQLIGAPSIGGIAASVLNTYHRIASVTSTTVTVTLPVAASIDALGSGGTGIKARGNFLERFRHYQTTPAFDSLRLVGSGRTGSDGVLVGNTLNPAGAVGDNRSTRGEIFRNTELHGFKRAVVEGSYDSYLQHSENVAISGSAIALSGVDTAFTGNRGERMTYDNWTIYDTSDYMIHSDSAGLNRKFDAVSLDFSQKGFLYYSVNAGYGDHSFSRAWWESSDDVPVRSDARPDAVNHLVTSVYDLYYLSRRTTLPVWNGTPVAQLSHTGGAWGPIFQGYQHVNIGTMRITDEQRFTDPAGLFMCDDEVRVGVGGLNAMFLGFNSGNTQRLISESVLANDNYNFSASDSSLLGWTVSGTSNMTMALQSPAGATLGTDPISVTNGSLVATITIPTHGLRALDEVIISGVASPIGGVPITSLNRRHRVRSVIDANTISVRLNFVPTGTAVGGTGCTAKEANFLRITSSALNSFGFITSDIFFVEPGQMWNANFKVRTAVGSTGTDRLDLRFRWLSANDREIGFSQTREARLGGSTGGRGDGDAIGLYVYTDVPDYVANNRSRPVMGLGCYRRVPAGAFKAQLQLEANSFGATDVVDIALIGANRMS